MSSFSLLMGAVLFMFNMAFGTTQHVFLSSNDSTPCFGDIVSLICYYPDVMEMGNEGFKSYATSANWLVNGKRIFPDGKVFDTGKINQTTSELIMKIDPSIFTGDLVSITCQPPLNSISEGEKSVLVDPQDTVMPPKVTDPVVNGTRVTVLWDHTNKGPCFNNLTFFYNITWYPVGISHMRDMQGIVTGPDAAQLTIITLMDDTDYQVKIVGFTLSDPVVYSEEATVNFTTKVSVPMATDDNSEGAGGGTIIITVIVVVVMPIILGTGIICIFTVSVCFRKRRDTPPQELKEGTPPQELKEDTPPRELKEGTPPQELKEDAPPQELKEGTPPQELKEDAPPRTDLSQPQAVMHKEYEILGLHTCVSI